MSMNKQSLICSTFIGTINHLHCTVSACMRLVQLNLDGELSHSSDFESRRRLRSASSLDSIVRRTINIWRSCVFVSGTVFYLTSVNVFKTRLKTFLSLSSLIIQRRLQRLITWQVDTTQPECCWLSCSRSYICQSTMGCASIHLDVFHLTLGVRTVLGDEPDNVCQVGRLAFNLAISAAMYGLSYSSCLVDDKLTVSGGRAPDWPWAIAHCSKTLSTTMWPPKLRTWIESCTGGTHSEQFV